MLEKNITEKNIETFVIKFYTKIMKDDEVGPFFINILGDDINNKKWQEHIELLSDFWASVTLGHHSYIGSPFAPHRQIQGLKRETFHKWLEIFFKTLDETYENNTSIIFKETGSIMAQNFMRNLKI